MSFVKFFVLLFLVTLCVAEDTEFTAFCDLARLVADDTDCPPDLSCAESYFSYEGVVASCSGSHITSLKASGLKLKTLPESLNAMSYLQMINIANNELTSLPVLGALKNLKTIYLYSNQLTTITGVFPNSTKIEFVSANNNKLTELPPEFGNATKLKNLNFDNNDVESIPESYKNLPLVGVGMSQNKIDCAEVRRVFGSSKAKAFAENCIQAQQRTEDDIPALPTSFSTEPPNEGLDAFEITSIILMVVFIVGCVLGIVFYVRYRNGGIDA